MLISYDTYEKLNGELPQYARNMCTPRNRDSTDPSNVPVNTLLFISCGMIEFAVDKDRCLQGSFHTPDGVCWASYKLVDHSRLTLKSKEEGDFDRCEYCKYSVYTYGFEQMEKLLGKGAVASRFLTDEDLLKIEGHFGAEKMIKLYEKKLRSLECWSDFVPHKEKPVKLYLSGSGEAAFIKLFPSVLIAVEYLEDLSKKPVRSDRIVKEMCYAG
jgi:hypothetical protein